MLSGNSAKLHKALKILKVYNLTEKSISMQNLRQDKGGHINTIHSPAAEGRSYQARSRWSIILTLNLTFA